MRWFKHYSDMHDGRTIGQLMEELGHTGLCFFLLQELCAGKLDKKLDQSLTDADCSFGFHTRTVRQKLRISQVNLERLLAICRANGQLDYKFTGNELEIKMPILLDLLDYDSKKSRSRRANFANQSRLEEEEDKEQEKDKEKDKDIAATQFSTDVENMSPKKKALTSEQKDLNKRIWESYKAAYLIRWKQEPLRNATVNGQISMLRSRLGEDAVKVVSFYVMSNNSFYVGKCHPISLCLGDAEGLRTQMLNGKAITGSMLKTFEKKTQSQEYQEEIKNLWKDDDAI